jgi:uncharacterized protein (DUF2249 family)/CRP-like cAMP-binding protein
VKVRAALDIRPWTTAERYVRVLAAFEALDEGAALGIIVDHEPRALRVRFSELHPGCYVWAQRNLDEDYWEVTVRRVAPLGKDAEPNEALLHCSSLFNELPETARKRLAQAAIPRVLDAGATVVEQGTLWPYLGLVAAGSVISVVSTDAGRDYALDETFASDVFGEIQALDTGVTIARYEAGQEETSILLLPRDLVLELADGDGHFARGLATACAQRSRLLHEMLYARVSKPTISRLAATILPYSTRNDGFSKALQPLPWMTQSQLARAVGTVNDVVGRDLAALQAAGAVDLRNGRIVRIDEARLRHFL